MSQATPISPSEDVLRAALTDIKTASPELGITKIHALLLSQNPTWTVSEKRVRKVLQSAGLVHSDASVSKADSKIATNGKVYPSSRLIEGLDVGKWTKKVEVKYFGREKGKGLVAKEEIAAGEVIWKEDPFILAPEWQIYKLQTESLVCQYCTTPLDLDSSRVVPCPASSSSAFCPARFCSLLCLKRGAKTHPLLCAARNPAAAPLLAFARAHEWLALHALAQCTARLLLAAQEEDGGAALEADGRVVRGLAELGTEERFKDNGIVIGEPDREVWQKAHQLFIGAFVEPPNTADKKKLDKIFKKPVPKGLVEEITDHSSFLHGLGRMSLNLEAHGGLYTLHSHLNHSCLPNVSVRHLDMHSALSRITVLSRRAVAPGEELLVSYVNPEDGVRARTDQLRQWGFGACGCTRCVEEEKALREGKEEEGKAGNRVDMRDLERELKAGLGVL